MDIKLKPFSKVSTLSSIFYTKNNSLDNDLIVAIFESSNFSLGQFLKKHCFIFNKKSLVSKDSRLKFILSNFEKQKFRTNWYKNIEKQRTDKQLNNFHNLIYRYITKEHQFLYLESADIKDCFWVNDQGRSFLLKSGIKQIIETCNYHNLSKKNIALYLWAFLDAHIWNATGFSPEDPFYTSSDILLNAFQDAEEHELINYFKPPSTVLIKPDSTPLSHKKTKEKKVKVSFVQAWKSPKELTELYKLIDSFFKLKDEIQFHLDHNELQEILKKSEKLDVLKKQYEKKFNFFRITLNKKYSTGIIESPSTEILASYEQEYNYLKQIDKTLSEVSKSVSKNIKREKESIRKKFKTFGLQSPEDIDNIKTKRQMNEFKSLWEPILLKEKIYNDCINNGFENSRIETLEYEHRFEVYKKLSENKEYSFIDYNSLLKRIITDPDLSNISIKNRMELILDLVKKYLKRKVSLPKNIWTLIKELNKGELFSVLQREKMLSLIDDKKVIDIVGFQKEFDGPLDQLPKDIRFSFELHEINSLDTKDQIHRLSDFLLDSKYQTQAAQALLLILYDGKKYDEAFYLAAIGSRMKWLNMADDDLHDLIFIVMCKNIKGNNNNVLIVKEIFDNFSLIYERPGDVIFLLFFCTFGNQFDGIHINFQYQEPDLYSSAIKSFPVISKYFLAKIEEREISSSKKLNIDQVISRGYNALKNFNNDLKRSSCFVNWPEAKKYQHYFVRKLRSEFLSIKKGDDSNLIIKAEEIIDNAQKEQTLEVVNNKIKTKMVNYINNQVGHLKVLKQTLQYVSLEELYTAENQIQNDFAKESSKITNKALKYLYNKVEKRL